MDLSRRELLRVTALGAAGLSGCASNPGDRQPWRTLSTATDFPGSEGGESPTSGPATGTAGPPGDDTTAPGEGTATGQPLPSPNDYCRADPTVAGDDPLTVGFDAGERFKCKGTPLDNFEDLDRWETYAGSLSADTTDAYSGSQSALLEAGRSDQRVWIYRTFDGPVDLSGQDLSLALRLDEPATEGVVVRLDAPDYRNAMFLAQNTWRSGWTRVDLGPQGVRGSPDLTRVTEISVQVYTGGGTPTRLAVDSLRRRARSAGGKVVLTFDDNLTSQYEQAFPRMQRYGFPGVVGVIPGTADYDSKIPLSGLREMQAAGWDMVSHPQQAGSFRALSRDDQERAIRESKRWLREHGFERGADFLLWPFGHYDRTALEVASRYHHLGFNGSGTPVGMVSSPLTIGRVDGEDVERVKRAVDFAAEYDLLLVLSYHAVANMTTGLAGRLFEETLSYIMDSSLEVVSAAELWASLEPGRETPAGRPG